MEELLIEASEAAIVAINAMALVVILTGTIEAFVNAFRVALPFVSTSTTAVAVWRRYGRWLVAALTFQLAADIVESSIAPSWDDIGKLAAVAVVRTFLNFFLERDLSETAERVGEPA